MPDYETHDYDVIIIGAGGSGLRAAIEAKERGLRVALVCKSLLGKAHTVMAEGGMAAAMGNVWAEDNWQVHFRDTMRGGKMLNNWRMAQIHAQEAPDRVYELERWGALFDRTKDGRITQRDFGGHRYARLAHVGDRTGLELIRTLQQKVVSMGTDVFMETKILRLLPDSEGRISGAGRHILMIGHAGHPEVEGTMGQLPPGTMTLIEGEADVAAFTPPEGVKLAFITQTTLSVDDTAALVAALRRKFPQIEGPKSEDICYATTNRQAAVKAIAPGCDLVLVIGSANSSNSQRLREVAERSGAARAVLIPRADALDWSVLDGVSTLGVTAGASAPELLVDELLTHLASRFSLDVEERRVTQEDVVFRLPAALNA